MTERPNPPRGADDDDLRDPHIDALWQATQADGPPARIDAALRAAARREIAGPERKVAMVAQAASRPEREDARVAQATRPERWWWPLAAAAVIGVVAVGILQLSPDEPTDRAVVSDMPATAKRKAEVATDKLMAPSDNDAARAKTAPLNARQEQPKTLASSNELREEAAAAPAQQRAQAKQDAYASDKAQPAAAPSAVGNSLQRYRETESVTGAAKDTRGAPVTGGLEGGKLQGGGGAAPAVGSRAIERDNAPARPGSGVLPPPASPAPPIAAPTEQPAQARSEAKERAPEPFPAGAVEPSTTPLPKANAAGAAEGKLDEGAAQRRDMLSDAPSARRAAPAAAAPGAAAGGAMPASPAFAKKAFNAQSPGSDDAKAQVRPVPEWIALIRRLRDENKVDEAAKELTAFRAVYPDADKLLPQDLRDWRPAKP